MHVCLYLYLRSCRGLRFLKCLLRGVARDVARDATRDVTPHRKSSVKRKCNLRAFHPVSVGCFSTIDVFFL